jgi:hypothetical protein
LKAIGGRRSSIFGRRMMSAVEAAPAAADYARACSLPACSLR